MYIAWVPPQGLLVKSGCLGRQITFVTVVKSPVTLCPSQARSQSDSCFFIFVFVEQARVLPSYLLLLSYPPTRGHYTGKIAITIYSISGIGADYHHHANIEIT